MGVLKRRTPSSAPPSPTRLRALPDGDLYLLVETSLMNAQQRLADYRQKGPGVRPAMLALLEAEVDTVVLGVQEMQSRL